MVKIASGVVVLLLVGSGPSQPANEITRYEARQLVLRVLEAQRTPTKSPKFDIEDNTGNERYIPGFYSFIAYFDMPARLATVGSYAVNRKTADVWEDIGCRRLGPPAIKPAQRALRMKMGLSDKEYRKLSVTAPCSPN
jgi:hypothetical protein